jgi:hypothetical protein
VNRGNSFLGCGGEEYALSSGETRGFDDLSIRWVQ